MSIVCGIYSILNIGNNKRYIGQAVNVGRRVKEHMGSLLKGTHHCKYLQRAFAKYGAAGFTSEVLEECPQAALTGREQYWMDYHKDRGIYNTAPAAGSTIGYKHTPETLSRLSAAWLTRPPMSDATRAKKSASMKGKSHPCSAEARAKISAAKTGSRMPPEQGIKISAALKGKKKSPEHIAKVAASNTGRKNSPEAIARMSASHKGHKMSEESKARLSRFWTGRRMTEETKIKISIAARRRFAEAAVCR
jgi:group I intron endonuclease